MARRPALRALLLLPFLGAGPGCDSESAPAPGKAPEVSQSVPAAQPKETNHADATPQALPDVPPARGLGFRVTRGERTLYLVGSLHVGTPSLYPLPGAISRAFLESEVLVEEIDLFLAKRPEKIAFMTERASLPPGETLSGRTSPEVQQLLSASPAARALGPGAQRLKPWFLSVAITMQSLEALGFQASLGIDQYFADEAEKRGMKYEAIETVESQVEAFSSLPDTTQDLMLKDTLEQLPNLKRDFERTLVAWQTGDLGAVDQVMMESMKKPEYEPVFQALFVERNRLMKASILRYLGTRPVEFVVLGSGHLVGSFGLVDALRRDGITVTQL